MISNIKTNSVQPIKDYKTFIIQWVSETLGDIDVLWDIPITKASTEVGFNVSIAYLRSITGCSESAATKYRYLAYPLIEKMIKENILVTLDEGLYIAAIEYRRKLLNWYRKLSTDSKRDLPIFGNKISFSKLPPATNPISKRANEYKLIKSTLNLIYEDLIEIGVLDSEYMSIEEKNRYKLNNPTKRAETREERFKRLSTYELKHIKDFITPTEAEPFIQIEQLFACQIKIYTQKSTINNYINACKNLIKFLIQIHGKVPLLIIEVFNEHLLSRFRQYLQQQIIIEEISSHYANSMNSAVRKTLNRLTRINGFRYRFFEVEGFDTRRQTDLHKPFTNDERLQLFEAIEKGLDESRKCLIPYKRTGIGTNPLNKKGHRKKGFSSLENAQWLFENKLNCEPVYYNPLNTQVEIRFLSILQSLKKNLHEVYKTWGVSPIIDADIILPYLLKLAQVTGLNPNSLLNLDIDDYVDCHPATLKPCLRYWKERSDGYKEYHLDLFKAELTWLTSNQAKSVKWIFKEIILLTKKIRHNIQDESSKNKLFIYESRSYRLDGKVGSILKKDGSYPICLSVSIAKFIKKYSLKDDKGNPLTLTISRFRPTLVSELLQNEVSLREVQLMLGHSSIRTTITYLDSYDFNLISRTKLTNEITEIHQTSLKEETIQQPLPQVHETDGLKVFFRTPFAECRNIFNPPEFIKNLSSYTPGNPCSQYNKCLSCDNVIITVQDVPKLFAMQRDYKHLLEHTQVANTPYSHVIYENLQLINSIINPDLSDFTSEELENAKVLSEYVEDTCIIDGVV